MQEAVKPQLSALVLAAAAAAATVQQQLLPSIRRKQI
jgi:hypothetical protein